MFTRKLFLMAIPIAIQTLLFSSKAFVDTFLLAQVSADDVSATGIIGRVMLVCIITLLGVSTGGGYVAAQCASDARKLNSSIVTTLLISLAVSLLICGLILVFDAQIIAMFTADSQITRLSETYLNIVLLSLVILAASSVIATYLRVTEHSTWVSAIISVGVILNVLISAILIHQYDFGIAGAAYGTLLGSVFEFVALAAFLLCKRISLFYGVSFSKKQFAIIREQIFTSTSSSVVWSLGAFLFYSFLGRSSKEALHAMSVIIPIESILLSLTMGIATASSILIGKAIPHESRQQIHKKALLSIMLCLCSVIVIVALFSLFKGPVIDYFSQGYLVYSLNSYIALMMLGVVVKSLSIQTMNGVIRSGGDGRFCMKLDIVMQWAIIIPTAYVMLQIGIEPLYIYALVLFEELIKAGVSFYRLRTDRWRHNLCVS